MFKRIKLLCDFMSSKELCETWEKMGHGNYSFTDDGKTIKICWDDNYDYTFVVNKTNENIHPPTTIYANMEPFHVWEKYPDHTIFKDAYVHTLNSFNNNEWHISKKLPELFFFHPEKKYDKTISAILSNKYIDPGHIFRMDLVYKTQDLFDWHIFGNDKKFKWKNYFGKLPRYEKDEGLFPYKYTFNVENNFIIGYYTEKIIDAILSECCCFYLGPPNITDLIDENAYILLDKDLDKSIDIIERALNENWYDKRINSILKAKNKILTETGFFPRLHKSIFS